MGNKRLIEHDDVAGDLMTIVKDARVAASDKAKDFKAGSEWEHTLKLEAAFEDLLMQKLLSYMSRHEAKVWNHAFQLGEAKAKS